MATSEAEGFLDHDGAEKDKPVRFHVRAIKNAATGCGSISRARRRRPWGRSISSPRRRRRCRSSRSSPPRIPTIPVNHGLTDAVEFVIPQGLVVSPRHPATVNHYFPIGASRLQRRARGLGQAQFRRARWRRRDWARARCRSATACRAPASRRCSTSCSTPRWAAPARQDGTPIVMAMCHFTPGAPVEIIESEYPLRVQGLRAGAR